MGMNDEKKYSNIFTLSRLFANNYFRVLFVRGFFLSIERGAYRFFQVSFASLLLFTFLSFSLLSFSYVYFLYFAFVLSSDKFCARIAKSLCFLFCFVPLFTNTRVESGEKSVDFVRFEREFSNCNDYPEKMKYVFKLSI